MTRSDHVQGFLLYNDSNLDISNMKRKMEIPEKERALVLQGGGSLGAYGVGLIRRYTNRYLTEIQTKVKKESLYLIL